MKPDFKQCVFGITEIIVADLDGLTKSKIEKTARFILSRHANMPDYLRLPFKIMALSFDAAPIITRGHPFHSLPASHRKRIVNRWKTSSMSFKRDFIRYFETLGVFAWYSYSEMSAAGEPQ